MNVIVGKLVCKRVNVKILLVTEIYDSVHEVTNKATVTKFVAKNQLKQLYSISDFSTPVNVGANPEVQLDDVTGLYKITAVHL